jgi:hypothetical protein
MLRPLHPVRGLAEQGSEQEDSESGSFRPRSMVCAARINIRGFVTSSPL